MKRMRALLKLPSVLSATVKARKTPEKKNIPRKINAISAIEFTCELSRFLPLLDDPYRNRVAVVFAFVGFHYCNDGERYMYNNKDGEYKKAYNGKR